MFRQRRRSRTNNKEDFQIPLLLSRIANNSLKSVRQHEYFREIHLLNVRVGFAGQKQHELQRVSRRGLCIFQAIQHNRRVQFPHKAGQAASLNRVRRFGLLRRRIGTEQLKPTVAMDLKICF